MAFITEDGTGKADATSYVTLGEADSYFADRGNATWAAATSDAKEQALIRATSFLDAQWRSRFRGRKNTKEQGLAWPRLGATIEGTGDFGSVSWAFEGAFVSDGFLIESNEIPQLIKDATFELGMRALSQDLAPDINPGAQNITRKKIGPIQIDYDSKYVPYTLRRYVTMLVQPLLVSSGINVTMVRS